jgi:PTS system nitrogen regulatory IIA component
MNIESILIPERTRCGMVAASKKKVLEQIAAFVTESMPQIDSEELYQNLIARERLGTTALGNGIAIPHCRLSACNDIVCALVQLQEAVDFGAYDQIPVKLIFLLIVPTAEIEEHLQTLSMLARHLETDDYRQALLNASTDFDLYQAALQEPEL